MCAVRTNSTHKSQLVGLTDFHYLCWLHLVSVFQLIQVATGRWKETEWRYTTVLCELKEVDRQVSKKLPASPLCDLWAEWVAVGPGVILQQVYMYRIVARFLAVWCKMHKKGVSPWTIISLVESLSTIFFLWCSIKIQNLLYGDPLSHDLHSGVLLIKFITFQYDPPDGMGWRPNFLTSHWNT